MFLKKKIKQEEVEKKSLVEKAVPIFIIYIITITILYSFYTILYSCGIIDPEPVEREWINYNISLIIPVIIGVGVIHLASMFLSKKLALSAIASALLCGLCGIWFLYNMTRSGLSIEIAFYFIVFAIMGFALFTIPSYIHWAGWKIKPVSLKVLIILLPIFIIAYFIIANNILIQKFAQSGKSELRYQMGLFRGKYAAMRDLKNGNAAILGYGLMRFLGSRFDKKTGLKSRGIAGCVIDSYIQGYAKSYNNYVRGSINKFGLPKNSKLKYSNIILNPTDYMYSDVDGNAILLKNDIVYNSPNGNSSIVYPSMSNHLALTHKAKKSKISFLSSKNPRIEIKWGPPASELLFIRVNPKKKTVKVLNDRILIYVIDVSDGGRFNIIEDKLVKLWKRIHRGEIKENDIFLYYTSSCARLLRSTEATVHNNGLVEAKFTDRKSPEFKHSFRLNKKELSTLHALVKSVNFFEQSEKDTHAGSTTIMVNDHGKRRTLSFFYRSSMRPLINALQKIVNHAVVISKLKKGEAYDAERTCSPHYRDGGVYAAGELKIELKKFIMTQSNKKQVVYALKALSWITTPEEWIVFLKKQIEQADTKRKSFLLRIISSHHLYYRIPKSHVVIELPYLTQIIQTYATNKAPIDKNMDEALRAVCQLLRNMGNEKSLPALRAFVAAHPSSIAVAAAKPAIYLIELKKKREKQDALIRRRAKEVNKINISKALLYSKGMLKKNPESKYWKRRLKMDTMCCKRDNIIPYSTAAEIKEAEKRKEAEDREIKAKSAKEDEQRRIKRNAQRKIRREKISAERRKAREYKEKILLSKERSVYEKLWTQIENNELKAIEVSKTLIATNKAIQKAKQDNDRMELRACIRRRKKIEAYIEKYGIKIISAEDIKIAEKHFYTKSLKYVTEKLQKAIKNKDAIKQKFYSEQKKRMEHLLGKL